MSSSWIPVAGTVIAALTLLLGYLRLWMAWRDRKDRKQRADEVTKWMNGKSVRRINPVTVGIRTRIGSTPIEKLSDGEMVSHSLIAISESIDRLANMLAKSSDKSGEETYR